MSSTARAALLTALLVAAVPAAVRAQTPAAPPTPPSTPPAAPQPADSSAAPSEGAAPAKPVIPATGYGWSTTPPRRHGPYKRIRPARIASASPDAILPGFETLGDGSTRLFVLLTKPVKYETRVARGVLTYVLKGAHVDRANNYNPLVTVHFNTPVTSARLVPHGTDLWFVVDLRADVTPSVTLDSTKEGGAMLRIDFPKGDYVPAQSAPPPPPPPASSPAPAPAPAGPASPPPSP